MGLTYFFQSQKSFVDAAAAVVAVDKGFSVDVAVAAAFADFLLAQSF